MSVYVTIALRQGILEKTHVFRSKRSADKAEKRWLNQYHIADGDHRAAKSQDGTEFIVVKCELAP